MESTSLLLTPVEQAALAESPFEPIYPATEHLAVLTVNNFPTLGRLVALRFLEWAGEHPGGVISLPTGKTPEYFIHWVTHLLATWETNETRGMLEKSGIDPGRKPDMRTFHFVQIDDFYPIDPSQKNSFYYYVKKFYIDGFGLDPAKAMLIHGGEIGLSAGQTLASVWPDQRVDLSLRTRRPVSDQERVQQQVLHRIDQWCQQYEDRIRELGGIGFFLGGIGPDGHIAFNIRGSDHHSTTRLMATNYETQAAAATDLGGIEVARERHVITIGLGTITFNPECTAIIFAAGEAKARVVADAVEGPEGVLIPASALRKLPAARFYITRGAALRLRSRRKAMVARQERASDEQVEMTLVDLALEKRKRVVELTPADVESNDLAHATLTSRGEPLSELAAQVRETLIRKIEAGSRTCEGTRFLHTEPHHDDLMLGYLPCIVRNVRNASNVHHFVTLTSGFTAVTNRYMQGQLEGLRRFITTAGCAALHGGGYFDPDNRQGRNRDIWQYLDGLAANNASMRDEGAARRLLRNLIAVFDESDLHAIADRMEELAHYFRTVYPGKKDPENIQRLKGMCREWEAECLWGYFGWQSSNIHHLRLGFYTGDIFTPTPTVERDVLPVLHLVEQVAPDVITVALDPEGSGPDTHYKVLQAVNEATERYARQAERDVRIWGYRNVWYRFHPSEANVFAPVSLNMFSVMESAFLNTFISQREASFPSFDYDGPFCGLAQQIQVEQYQMLKTCLGREWFFEHPSPLIRATRGLVFIKQMDLEEFRHTARRLRQAAEAET